MPVYNISVTGFVYLKLEIRVGQEDGMSFEQRHAVACGLMCSGARDFVLSFGFTSFFVNQEINRPLVALVLWSWVLTTRVLFAVSESWRAVLVSLPPSRQWDLIPGPVGYVISETKPLRGVSRRGPSHCVTGMVLMTVIIIITLLGEGSEGFCPRRLNSSNNNNN